MSEIIPHHYRHSPVWETTRPTAEPHPTVCAIDLGSKNFKMVTGSKVDGAVVTELIMKKPLALGKALLENANVIGAEKRLEVEQALLEFKRYCDNRAIHPLLAIATNAIRDANNRDEIAALARAIGIDLEIADGRREAEVGYLAATGGQPGKLVVEMGSRSLQVAWETAGRIETRLIDRGYEHAFQAFFRGAPHFSQALMSYRGFLGERLGDLPRGSDQLFALAANTLAGFVAGKAKEEITDRSLSKTALEEKIRALEQATADGFASLVEGNPKAGKILPGLVLLELILEKSGHDAVFIANAELPVGLIIEYFTEFYSRRRTR